MRNSEWSDNNALCCCEYYNIEQERSHILGCCCNCQDLDEGFDNFLTGQTVPQDRKSAIMTTFRDRFRIPWRGGAKQISPDCLVPVLLVPLSIYISALDFSLTLVILLLLSLFLNHAFNWFRANQPKTKFFLIWGIVSILTIAIIFQVYVIPLYEILLEENFACVIITALFVSAVCRVKITGGRWQQVTYTQLADEESPPEKSSKDFCTICKKKYEERMYHCLVCQNCVPERDFHFVWFDCCIGSANNGMFLLSLILAIVGLLYSANLTLTTICHPFTVFENFSFMLPDDCSEVYDDYQMSLCFTSALYSLLIAAYLLWILLRQLLSISLGLTGQEWRRLPLSNRLCCGLKSIRPYNQGCYKNWLRIFRNKKDKGSYIDT